MAGPVALRRTPPITDSMRSTAWMGHSPPNQSPTGQLQVFDPTGNTTAFNTVFTYDIYQSYLNKSASDTKLLWMGRMSTVVGILLSIATAYVARSFNNIMDLLQLVFAFINAPLFATFMLGMFWKRATAAGAFYGLLSGTLAADTTVTIDGEIFGKPRDERDAHAMLSRLSARWHEVLTAVVVSVDGRQFSDVVTTRVEFRALTAATIAAYWRSGEPADKAGAYGIQGLGGALVKRIDGSYGAVVGLPLCETIALLDQVGIRHALSA